MDLQQSGPGKHVARLVGGVDGEIIARLPEITPSIRLISHANRGLVPPIALNTKRRCQWPQRVAQTGIGSSSLATMTVAIRADDLARTQASSDGVGDDMLAG